MVLSEIMVEVSKKGIEVAKEVGKKGIEVTKEVGKVSKEIGPVKQLNEFDLKIKIDLKSQLRKELLSRARELQMLRNREQY